MKTKLLIVPFLLLTGMVFGQEEYKCKTTEDSNLKSKTICINPFGSDEIPKKFKKGDYVKFQITNVNVFKVKGYTTVQGSDITYNVPQSVVDLLKSDTEGEAFVEGKLDTTEISFKNTYKSFVKNYSDLLQYQNLENRLQSHLGDSIFIKNVCVVRNNAESDYEILYDKKDRLDAKKEVKNKIVELQENYTLLSVLYNEINKNVVATSTKISGDFTSKDGKTTLSLKDAMVKSSIVKKFETEFEYAKKIAEAVNSKADSITNKAFSGIDLYHLIEIEDFKITTDAQQLNNDIVTITPELKSASGKIKHTFNSYTLQTCGHLKVDFSTGYLLSFRGNENYNSFTNTKGATEITKSNSDEITQALGVLMNVYWQQSNSAFPQFGLSFGASISEDTNIGFYGGLSAFFLEKNRLVFTAGLSFVKIKELNTANLSSILDSENYLFTNSTDTEIRYNDIYKPAFFVGVTFNVFNSEN